MLIAVEATRLEREVRGIGRYVRAMLPRLLEQRPDLQLMLFAKTKRGVASLAASLAGFARARCQTATTVLRCGNVREMARTPADLYWYPWNVVRPVPIAGRRS